jgi:hypothetical protein
MKKANGLRVDPAPTVACSQEPSVRPTTEINADFLERELPDIAQPRDREAQRLGRDDPAKEQERGMPTERAASSSPRAMAR